MRKVISGLFAWFFLFFVVTPSFASDVIIDNNGSSSVNTVNVSSATNTQISQGNKQTVTNSVDTETNTGNNHADGNTGGSTTIATGDSQNNASVVNSGNTNTAIATKVSGSTTPTSVAITDNGSDSLNTVNVHAGSSGSVSQTNDGHIANTGTTSSETGKNMSNGNVGDTSIQTGSSRVTQDLENKDININTATIPASATQDLSLVVKNNGSNTENTITVTFPKEVNIFSSNELNLFNTLSCSENTGLNEANQNVGSAHIVTGFANCESVIKNEKLNISSIKFPEKQICQEIPPIVSPPPIEQKPPGQEIKPPSGEVPTSSPSVPSVPVGAPGNVVSPPTSQVLGAMSLPPTGGNMPLYGILSTLVLFVGLLLRFLSQKKFNFQFEFLK